MKTQLKHSIKHYHVRIIRQLLVSDMQYSTLITTPNQHFTSPEQNMRKIISEIKDNS
jgi:hypothetical protein